jgi:uncharacterized protein YecE (DUF72 family)
MKKLHDVEVPLANFFASGVLALNEKLGPILWQLPPTLGWNRDRLEEFFRLLPRDTEGAVRLARKHDQKLKARAWLRIEQSRPLRHAIEVRHATFLRPEFFQSLRAHNVAFVIADTAGKWPYAEDLTADLVYIRLHGDEQLYVSGYSDAALDRWARRIDYWRQGKQPNDARTVTPHRNGRGLRDVYVYFDNDAKVHAPFDALSLAGKIKAKRHAGSGTRSR